MLSPSSPPPSTLSAFVGLLKFVVRRLLHYWDSCNINKNGLVVPISIDNLYELGRSSKLIGDRFEVGRCTKARPSPGSCKHKLRTPCIMFDQERFLLGTDLKKASTTTRLMGSYELRQYKTVCHGGHHDHHSTHQGVHKQTASSNKTLDVDPQSVLPAASVSYTVHVPRRAEEVDETMPSFENKEKSRKSPCE
ncbi:hypothetical protein HID58_053591 [Brassica napus]|uniref:Uncharacterized protein n=1 Tax=Brassica napus TaxID=3708 RepID=A0ABQ8AF47_BRANA|nr:hypothetical protein HID58_053591 [Brassica napus]